MRYTFDSLRLRKRKFLGVMFMEWGLVSLAEKQEQFRAESEAAESASPKDSAGSG